MLIVSGRISGMRTYMIYYRIVLNFVIIIPQKSRAFFVFVSPTHSRAGNLFFYIPLYLPFFESSRKMIFSFFFYGEEENQFFCSNIIPTSQRRILVESRNCCSLLFLNPQTSFQAYTGIFVTKKCFSHGFLTVMAEPFLSITV